MKRLVSLLMIILLLASLFSSAFAADTAIVTKLAGTKGSTVRMRQNLMVRFSPIFLLEQRLRFLTTKMNGQKSLLMVELAG